MLMMNIFAAFYRAAQQNATFNQWPVQISTFFVCSHETCKICGNLTHMECRDAYRKCVWLFSSSNTPHHLFYAVLCIWVMDFAKGTLRLANSHCIGELLANSATHMSVVSMSVGPLIKGHIYKEVSCKQNPLESA